MGEKCPECEAFMLEKGNKNCCSDEQCGFVENIEKQRKTIPKFVEYYRIV